MPSIFSPQFIFQVLVRILVVFTALPLHEYAHGFIAKKLGDHTATNQGRLTLNPLAHFDLIGTTALILTGYGWAKPVPINPYNFRYTKLGSKLGLKGGMALTALAGPVSNILLAVICMILFKIMVFFIPFSNAATETINTVLTIMYQTNIGLAVFNLLPIPPLDGSRIFAMFFSNKINQLMYQYERVIFIGLLFLMMSGALSYPLNIISNFLYTILDFLTKFIDIIARLIS